MRRVLAVVAMLLSANAYADISGTYLSTNSNGVAWMQLIQTPDGKLSGEVDTAALQPNNSINYDSSALTGTTNGTLVSIQFKLGSFFRFASQASGTFSRDTLTLTATSDNGPATMTLTRSTPLAYQTAIADLKTRSQSLQEEKAEQDFGRHLTELTPKVTRWNTKIDALLVTLQPVDSQFSDFTERMRKALAREKLAAAMPNAGVTRAQLGQGIVNLSFQSEKLHGDIESLQGQYNSDVAKFKADIDQSDINCKNTPQPQCVEFAKTIKPFYERWQSLGKAINDILIFYQEQKRIQDDLVKQSQALG